jgi:uncharacterized protein (TIGR02246 family)
VALSEPDVAAIRAAERALAAAFDDSDRTAWVHHYTEDAVFAAPGLPTLEGRDAFLAAAAQTMLSSLQIAADSTIGAGDFAATVGQVSFVAGPKGSKAPTRRRRFLMVWRRGADGRWRIARELLNDFA